MFNRLEKKSRLIPSSERIPFLQKICFAAGVCMDYVSINTLKGVLWMPVFNIGFGLDPVILGMILMVFCAVDAFTDPLMGNLSDNAHTRWGRRRPFMVIGAILVASILPFFWFMPSSWSDTAKSIYLTTTGIIYFCAYTVWSMPYYGMQMELTPNYDERSRLTAWMSFFGKISFLGANWFLPLVLVLGAFAVGDVNIAPDTGKSTFLARYLAPLQTWVASLPGVDPTEKPIIVGSRIACWLLVVLTLFFGLLPALFTKERYYKKTSQTAKEPLWQSIKESFSCRPLWMLIGCSFFLNIGNQSVYSLGQYVNYYYVNHGDLTKGAFIGGWKSTVAVIVGLSCLPVFVKLGEYFDKRRVAIFVITLAIMGHISNYFCMTPKYPYLQIVSGVFEACSLGAFWMFLPSMKADVADYDELYTKRRREGSINAFYSWFVKIAATLAVGFGGVVFDLTGFDAKIGNQPQEVLSRMFWVYLVLPLFFWCAAIIILVRYPLGREKSTQIRSELEARRGKF